MAKVHSFLISASFGPADVLAMLRRVAEDPRHRGLAPEFAFDWLQRRAALSASTAAGVETLLADLRRALAASKAGEGALLIGKTTELPNGRHEAPIGIAVMDAATYGDLIRQSLVETSIRGVRLEDTDEGCVLQVPVSLLTQGLPYDDFIRGFPVPSYVQIKEIGFQEAPKAEKKKGGKK